MPISGVNPTPRTTAVYAADPALPRRPQDSLPSRLLSFGRTRLALASSYRLLLSHPASGFLAGLIAGIWRAGDTSVNPWSRFALAARYSFLGRVRPFFGRFEAHRQSPWSRHLRNSTRSQGPSLPRRYPCSAVL